MVTIVDYNMGNIRSVAKAFEAIGQDVYISNNKKELERAERIVLPGVGAFAEGMKHLIRLDLADMLYEEVIKKGKPFLGICLGMQLIARISYEDGKHKGLGWLDADVHSLKDLNKDVKIPHIGWNDVFPKKGNLLFYGLEGSPVFYFVHSYCLVCDTEALASAVCDYGGMFVAGIEYKNIFATQFHPEKSQTAGLKLLRNFVNFKT